MMHTARHTYATTAMLFGIPLPTIAKTMGHANMRMIQHYARVLPEKIINDTLVRSITRRSRYKLFTNRHLYTLMYQTKHRVSYM